MKQKPIFRETQRFTQWWIWLIHILILAIFFTGIYIQIINGTPFGNKPISDAGLIISSVFMLLLVLLFLSFNLKTEITSNKIHFKFFPFHLKEKEYLISDIQEMEVVKYSPIREYGGWGIRGFGSNKAFNVKGNMGLKILFKDGTKRLIGTQKPKELEKVIKELGF